MKTIHNTLSTIETNFSLIMANEKIYQDLATIFFSYLVAFLLSLVVKKYLARIYKTQSSFIRPFTDLVYKIREIFLPAFALVFLNLSITLTVYNDGVISLIKLASIIAALILFYAFVQIVISNSLSKRIVLSIGIPILFFHLIGFLDDIRTILDATAIEAGDIRISIYGISKVIIFGSLFFWIGRVSNATGKKIIKNQIHLDFRTKEVFSKLLEVMVFFIFCLLLLQVMGINLTALAVFGGAIGVGLGFGLQSIASNFISGIIILLDRSVSLNDYIEMDDGKIGRVTEMTLRATTLETYDGKDVVVPNEKFISSSFVNWTHKDTKQRYRVDFSVAYSTDIRKLAEIIKSVVSEHPQVLSGEEAPFEEKPDCEIDSFGDSGINMFVEFWMEGIDDGKNRVGGDLLLAILEAIRDNGFEIPFPQREVRIIKS